MTQPMVDATIPATEGTIRLHSAVGGIESMWIVLRDVLGNATLDESTGLHVPLVRLTPSQARALSDVLRIYADSHRDSR